MRNSNFLSSLAAAAIMACASMGAIAQPPVHGIPSSHNTHPKMEFNLFGHGKIIGNKRTHVYHLPGDKGNLPEAKNRIYFRTEAEARRAGYHMAGKPHGKMMPMHGKMPMGHKM